MTKYNKAFAAVVATILSGIAAASTDGVLTGTEKINIAIIAIGACGVFAAPNVPGARYTKSIIAVLTAVLTLLASQISDGLSGAELVQLAIAGLGALGVYAVPNQETTVSEVGY